MCAAVLASGCMASGGPADDEAGQAEAARVGAATRFPIVLAHGLFGFDQLFGVLEYFNGIPEELSANGARVFVTQVSAVNSSDVRGEQLISQIETILATTGAAKVNLIGHSQGGLDVRFVAATRPDLIASVTTVGTPHKGTPVADFAAGMSQPASSIVAALASSLGTIIELLSGSSDPQDAQAALASLTTAGAAAFNARFPAGVPTTACGNGAASANGIALFSIGGTSTGTNIFDISDPLLALTGLLFNGAANDGLVGRCSAHFGTVIRDNFRMNHLDEVNQLLGLTSIFETPTPAVWVNLANRLKTAGL
jgi:triacylglycerol lipase